MKLMTGRISYCETLTWSIAAGIGLAGLKIGGSMFTLSSTYI